MRKRREKVAEHFGNAPHCAGTAAMAVVASLPQRRDRIFREEIAQGEKQHGGVAGVIAEFAHETAVLADPIIVPSFGDRRKCESSSTGWAKSVRDGPVSGASRDERGEKRRRELLRSGETDVSQSPFVSALVPASSPTSGANVLARRLTFSA